jgi:hypothetical protein
MKSDAIKWMRAGSRREKWQNMFCLEARRVGRRGRELWTEGRNGPNNVCTHE